MSSVNVQTFIDARNLGRINTLLGDSLGRLSSGSSIAKPSEDPSGVGAVAKLTAQNKRAQAASVNVQNAASLVQAATGFMAKVGELLTRMGELAQAASDPVQSAADIANYQTEFKQLQEQLRATVGGSTAEIGGTTAVDDPLGTFNDVALFGSNPAGTTVASGSQSGISLTIPETNLRNGDLSDLFRQDASGEFLMSVTDASTTTTVTAAISEIANSRSVLAGVSSRLDFAASRLAVESQNIEASVSRISDTDIATESTRLSKLNILLESGTAMLSQANQNPRTVLKLLQV